MGIVPLDKKYANEIYGVLHCYDRIIISGNLQPLCYAAGMTQYLYRHGIRIFDYGKQFAEPLRDAIRANAQAVAEAHGLEIEFISKADAFRKEDRIAQILARGAASRPGAHLPAMERCPAYRPWHDKVSGRTYVTSVSGKCLHYYFYFVDPELGLCYLRVPTWAPFRLQFFCNGHNVLAAQLTQAGMAFEQADNAFLRIADFDRANQLAAGVDIKPARQAGCLCRSVLPSVDHAGPAVSVEHPASRIRHRYRLPQPSAPPSAVPPLLEALIQAVKPADIATFLGRKLHGNFQDELGTRFNRRWLGRRLKHHMGPVTLKLYDKFNIVLRIETTVNRVAFFSQYRQVQHRDGSVSSRHAPMQATIYSLPPLAETLQAVNRRYLKFISAIETPEVGRAKLHRLAETQEQDNHRHKGFNLLTEEDAALFRLLLSGEFVIHGFSNQALRAHLADKTVGQITRLLKRLRVHGLIKRVAKRYRYYLTDFGYQVAALALKLREMVIIPELAHGLTP